MMSDTVLHVLVVGFHHKKGCVVEYATPPLITGQDSRSGEVSTCYIQYPLHCLHFLNPILSYLLNCFLCISSAICAYTLCLPHRFRIIAYAHQSAYFRISRIHMAIPKLNSHSVSQYVSMSVSQQGRYKSCWGS